MKKDKLIGRIFGIALVLVMIGMMSGGLPALTSKAEAFPGIIYVPDNYPTIQIAVDASNSSDTTIVQDITYTENAELTITSASIIKTPIYVGDKFCVTAGVKNTGDVPLFTYNVVQAEFEPEDAVSVEGEPWSCLYRFELYPGESGATIALCGYPDHRWFRALKAGPVTCTVTASWDLEGDGGGYTTKTFTFTIEESPNAQGLSTIWDITWGGSKWEYGSGIAGDDGSLYVTGRTSSFGVGYEDVFLLKVDKTGTILWARTWGTEYWEGGEDLCVTNNAVYVASGAILKFSKDGELIWSKTVVSGDEGSGSAAIKVAGNEIYVGSAGCQLAKLVEHDSSVEVKWALATPGFEDTDIELCDSSVYVAYKYSPLIAKFTADGQLVWTKELEVSIQDIAVSSEGIFVAGYGSMCKLDLDGDLLWAKQWDMEVNMCANAVQVVGGYVYVVGTYGSFDDGFVVILDSNGNTIYSYLYGDSTHDDWFLNLLVSNSRIYAVGNSFSSSRSLNELDIPLVPMELEVNLLQCSVESIQASIQDVQGVVTSPTDFGGGSLDVFTACFAFAPSKNEITIRGPDTEAELDSAWVGDEFRIHITVPDNWPDDVRFSIDDTQDGVQTGTWSDWYAWNDLDMATWDKNTRTIARVFETGGPKEVWAEVKFEGGASAVVSTTAFANFAFAQITDTHIGEEYTRPITWERSTPSPSVWLAAALQKMGQTDGDEVPQFILATGDIADSSYMQVWGLIDCTSLTYHSVFSQLVDDYAIAPVYTAPGNHDHYCVNSLYWVPYEARAGLGQYNSVLSSRRPSNAQTINQSEGGHDDYVFEYGGLQFIGLDSGRDETDVLDPVTIIRVGGDGLTDAQFDALEELDEAVPKIVLMHHPWQTKDSRGDIASNRERFQDFTLDYNVQLVLAGHTHEAWNWTYLAAGHNVQEMITPSTCGDGAGYRLIYVTQGEDGKPQVIPQPVTPVTESDAKAIEITIGSPVELEVYDSEGRCMHITKDGILVDEIPDAIYVPPPFAEEDDGEETPLGSILLFDIDQEYVYAVKGEELGTYDLSIRLWNGSEGSTWFMGEDIPCTHGSVNRYTIDWDALFQGKEGITIEIDSDGDGDFEETITTSQPNTPSSTSPASHATGIDLNADLNWTGGDPDAGDNVTYGVYFGNSSPPPFKAIIGPYPATQSTITYDPGTLAYNTKYYWQIIASDNHGITREGPIWDFTTQAPLGPTVTWNCPLGGQALIAPNPGAGRPSLSVPADCAEITTSVCAELWGIYYLVEIGPEAGTWLWYIPGFVGSTLTQLVPGEYYWVVVSAPCTLTIPQW